MSSTTRPAELDEILETLRKNLPHFAERYRVKSLGVFGSYVRGEAKPDSDLDILVEFSVAPSLFEFVRLQRSLAELVDTDVDLVMKSGLKPAIGRQILAEVVPV